VDTRKQYWDVIVSDLTDPLQEGPSAKLFTHEYFARCRQALAPGGCFVLQAGLTGPSEMHMHTRLVRTVTGVFERVFHFASHVPTWASPMGFVIGTDRSVQWNDPDPGAVDVLLARKIDGRLRMFDGRAFRGLMHPPKYLRDAVAAETEVFTLDNLPLSI
jgi:spermidine synthase